LKIKNLTRQQKRVTETQQGQKGTKKLNAVKGQAKQQQNKTLNNNKKNCTKTTSTKRITIFTTIHLLLETVKKVF